MKEPMSEADRFLPECRVCQFYTCNVHLRCAVHPSGVESEQCLDFTLYQPSVHSPRSIEVYPAQKDAKQRKKSA
ncbi:hypothetical protein [Leptolyngbya sp. FACHB-711]|uniref:hypothetical protein n=2 Tax=unclassified Leptolyngbya TaxID=2650499 RepID=UPI001689F895|nr:hypothetical protein [Leptolyngbya sp. FACHB-711]MBD2022938.1 hypothetical protein [Leptolyngbya sp. FACHB-711]